MPLHLVSEKHRVWKSSTVPQCLLLEYCEVRNQTYTTCSGFSMTQQMFQHHIKYLTVKHDLQKLTDDKAYHLLWLLLLIPARNLSVLVQRQADYT